MLACLWPAPVTIGRPSTSPSMFRASTLARMLPWTQHPLLSTGGLRSTRPGRSKIPAANPMCSPSLSPMPDSSSTLPCKSWSTLGPGRAPMSDSSRTPPCKSWPTLGPARIQGLRWPPMQELEPMHARCWQAPMLQPPPAPQTRQPRIFPPEAVAAPWRGTPPRAASSPWACSSSPAGCAGGDAASFSTAESTENQPYGDTP